MDVSLNRMRAIGPSGVTRLQLFAVLVVAVATLPCLSSEAAAEAFACGDLANAYGPFDYNNPEDRRTKLPIVEANHFDTGVENLTGHNKAGGQFMVGGDIDYTLRAFPNHPRALQAMVRYQLTKTEYTKTPMHYTADCYFDRAERFRPDDATVWMLHGYYLLKQKKPREALPKYEKALELSPESAEIQYNAGLLYLELDRVPDAVEHARKAYALGYPLPGLMNRLKRIGAWPTDMETGVATHADQSSESVPKD